MHIESSADCNQITPSAQPVQAATPSVTSLIIADLRAKALWRYERHDWKGIIQVVFADGTPAMLLYRFGQWARKYRLAPLEMMFNKISALFCNCVIGRGAQFGPGFVLNHSLGVVINGQVRGGANIYLEHQVTIGADRGQSPILGNDVYVGAGAKIIGAVMIGDGARIGANAVVVRDIPRGATAVGIPARVVRQRCQ